MKAFYSICTISSLLLVGCASKPSNHLQQQAQSRPCEKALYQPVANGILRAKGEGTNSSEALRVALANIAVQQKISVQSNSTSITQKSSRQVQQAFERKIQSKSHYVFTDYKVLCESQHVVVASYDNRPLTERIKSLLQQAYPQGWQLTGSQWLLNSPALKFISTGQGFEPVKTKVFKQDQFWYLSFNESQLKLREGEWRYLYNLPSSEKHTAKLWLENEYKEPIATTLQHEQEFRFNLKVNRTEDLFMSLVYFQQDGEAYPVRVNLAMTKHKTVPNPPNIFSAEGSIRLAIDDYLVILSKHKITPPSKNQFNQWLDLINRYSALGIRLLVKER